MSSDSPQPTGSRTAALADAPAPVAVTDEGTGDGFVVPEGRTILESALAQGVGLRYGCRVGVCGACAVEVVEGLACTTPPDAIERNTLDRYDMGPGVRLACRTMTRGPLRIKPA